MLTFLKSLPLTFYSSPFYCDLVRTGKGIGLGFLLLATFLSVIGFFRSPSMDVYEAEKNALLQALPPVTIQDGRLSLHAEGSFSYDLLKDIPGGPLKIVIDPSQAETDPSAIQQKMAADGVLALAGQNRIYIYDKTKRSIDSLDIKSFPNGEIGREEWMRLGEQIDSLIIPGLFLFLLGMFFSLHFVLAFLGASFLVFVGGLLKASFPFAAYLRLAATTQIPVVFLGLFLPPHLALQGLVWFGFAAFGLLSAQKGPPAKAKQVGK